MRNRLLALLLLALAIGAGWYFLSHTPREGNALTQMQDIESGSQPLPGHLVARPDAVLVDAPQATDARGATGMLTGGLEALAAAKPGPAVLPALPAGLTPVAVLDQMRNAVHLYASMFGANPVGANFEITRTLNGGNARHVQFIRPESGMRVNAQGELVDAWGTPFFFHQLSATQMEIRSAGPDRILWTADDLVVR